MNIRSHMWLGERCSGTEGLWVEWSMVQMVYTWYE